jgi:hypothetical protein
VTKALEPSELAGLAKQINEAHHEVEASFGQSLRHAIVAGGGLAKAKDALPHGQWLPWLEKNIRFSQQSASVYRNVYENRALLQANYQKAGNLTLDAALRLLKGGQAMLQSMSNDWYTPEKYIIAAREVMGDIDLDPASCAKANKTVKAKEFYSEDDDGLNRDWYGRVFLNPPYGKLGSAFAAKLYESLGSGVDEAVLLVNSRATDADWFQPCFNGAICFTDHRIDFDSPEDKPTSSTHGSCFVYFGPHEERFAEVFAKYGNVVKRWPN